METRSMAVNVKKLVLNSVNYTDNLESLFINGEYSADEVVAVIGKTEGNGGVNDFTRILADQAYRELLIKHGTKSKEEIDAIPMIWSGGCDGVITPHSNIFFKTTNEVSSNDARLTIGTAISEEILPEEIGRLGMINKVADAVRSAMKDASITDPSDVHYVQTKTPLLTVEDVLDAESRGKEVACEIHDSMGVSNGTTALGIGVALEEIKIPNEKSICKDLNLYSSVASCSSGVELTRAQVVLFGNKVGEGGNFSIGHSIMKDALDIEGIYQSIRNAGLSLPQRAKAEDLSNKLVNLFIKCEADRRGVLRGRRQIMLDDSDVHHHRHSKAAVGGVAAAAIGDPAVFVSVDAMHQGPHGGGPVIAIIEND